MPAYCIGNVILLVEVTECVEKLGLDFFCRGHPAVFVKFLVSVQHNNI